MNTADLIKALALQPHCEGGYFRRSYTAKLAINVENTGQRAIMSSIYYLLTHDQPIGKLHRNQSDIMHYWQGGSSIQYYLIDNHNKLTEVTMGPNILAGEYLQLMVPGGIWKASQLLDGEYGLISEAVAPEFNEADRELADAELINADFPQYWELLKTLV